VFFDPFKEYVVVLEATRQRYTLRRELLAKGVDPANLSVFEGLCPSERVTSAAVTSYRGQFLLTQGRMGNRSGRSPAGNRSLRSPMPFAQFG